MINNDVVESIDFCGLCDLKYIGPLAIFNCTVLSEIIYSGIILDRSSGAHIFQL